MPSYLRAIVEFKSNWQPKGIKKRFASMSLSASAASMLYKILSQYDVHGGTPSNILGAAVAPTGFSCGFVNRKETDELQQVDVLANAATFSAWK